MALKHHVAFTVPLKREARRPSMAGGPSSDQVTANPPRHDAALPGDVPPFVEDIIVNHFMDLGYQLVNEGPGEWRFHRGNKWAVCWRFNIRAYSTDLLVRASIQPDNTLWVSCDFEVWTFMSIVMQGDVATLAAEGNELESALRHAE